MKSDSKGISSVYGYVTKKIQWWTSRAQEFYESKGSMPISEFELWLKFTDLEPGEPAGMDKDTFVQRA